MKLLRHGPKGHEKPGVLDAQGQVRDLSGLIGDLTPRHLSPEGLATLRATCPMTALMVSALVTAARAWALSRPARLSMSLDSMSPSNMRPRKSYGRLRKASPL